MRQLLKPVVLSVAVLALAGCGGSSGISDAQKQKASDEFAMADANASEHLQEHTDLPPAVEESARLILLKQDTAAIIALVRKWDDAGMSSKEIRRHLADAETVLSPCAPCVATISLERANYH